MVLNMDWHYFTAKEPNICGSLVWNWLHFTAIGPGVVKWLLLVTTD